MPESFVLFTAGFISIVGFALMALGQERHWEAVTGMQADRRMKSLRLLTTGLLLQCFACALTILAQGASFGVLIWAVGMTATSTSIAFLLTWHPKWLTPVALCCKSAPGRTHPLVADKK